MRENPGLKSETRATHLRFERKRMFVFLRSGILSMEVRACVRKGQVLRSEPGWRQEPNLRVQRECKYPCRIVRFLARLAILFCMIETAQAQYGFEVWTVDNGMPENEIRGITQTPDGYLWIATFNGLARFDGVHLTLFNRETPGLLSNQFGTMLQGKAGDLWLDSVDRGLVRYHDGVFHAYAREGRLASD